MFPNPQGALPFPPRPNLEHYKKRAKDLVRACKSDDDKAIRIWAAKWLESLAGLQDSAESSGWITRMLDDIEKFARNQLSMSSSVKTRCALAHAQFVIARVHGFQSWPKLVRHLEGLTRKNSPDRNFEMAAEAIVNGDFAALQHLLEHNPELARARSAREHQATLLHYVSANGVEGYRQRTPKNVVRIAEILLQAGADVDAEADVYGGGATTLSLVATSVHPERAGVQQALMELLLAHGAAIGHPAGAGNRQSLVPGCLANGRGMAAEFLAQRGAPLDLEGAAGVGRLDVVASFFTGDGKLKENATSVQLERGFLWACEYGRKDVVAFLLDKGVDLLTQANTGETGLHWAVIGGQLDLIQLLLEHGASLESKNVYGGTALGQALWSAVNSDNGMDYVQVIETLLAAGAQIEDGTLAWLEQQEDGSSSLKLRITEVLRRHGAKS